MRLPLFHQFSSLHFLASFLPPEFCSKARVTQHRWVRSFKFAPADTMHDMHPGPTSRTCQSELSRRYARSALTRRSARMVWAFRFPCSLRAWINVCISVDMSHVSTKHCSLRMRR